mgnify:FL=1
MKFILGHEAFPEWFVHARISGEADVCFKDHPDIILPLKHAQFCKDIMVVYKQQEYHYGDVISE